VGSTAPVGSVLGTNPAGGASCPETKPVASQDPARPPLPSCVGQTISTAEQWAAQNQITLKQQQDPSSQQPSGTITGQTPAPNTPVAAGETIVVKVSTGPPQVTVPNGD